MSHASSQPSSVPFLTSSVLLIAEVSSLLLRRGFNHLPAHSTPFRVLGNAMKDNARHVHGSRGIGIRFLIHFGAY